MDRIGAEEADYLVATVGELAPDEGSADAPFALGGRLDLAGGLCIGQQGRLAPRLGPTECAQVGEDEGKGLTLGIVQRGIRPASEQQRIARDGDERIEDKRAVLG